jgi:hypothetical protein
MLTRAVWSGAEHVRGPPAPPRTYYACEERLHSLSAAIPPARLVQMTTRSMVGLTAAVACVAISGCGEGGEDRSGTPAANATRSDGLSAATKRGLDITAAKVSPVVQPENGSPRTRFVVTFTTAETTGVFGQVRRSYSASARGPDGVACIFDPLAPPAPPAQAGARVALVFDPRRIKGPRWCKGEFRGRILITVGYACTAQGQCHVPDDSPQPRPRQVGRFRFTVQ